MSAFFDMIHESLPFKLVGIGIIVWAFYTLIAHPDRVLIDSIMHKRKKKYEEAKEEQKRAAAEKTAAELGIMDEKE